jgi:hypothetical protein
MKKAVQCKCNLFERLLRHQQNGNEWNYVLIAETKHHRFSWRYLPGFPLSIPEDLPNVRDLAISDEKANHGQYLTNGHLFYA